MSLALCETWDSTALSLLHAWGKPRYGWSLRGVMVFAKRLREGVVRGDITCSVRIWTSPHVTEGCRYRMGEGEIEIESITPIGFPDVTPELARESGFLGVLDLLKVASTVRAITYI